MNSIKLTKQLFKPLICIIVGFCLSLGLCIAVKNVNNFNVNSEGQFGATHYFMMGLNDESEGCYSADDVAFSRSFKTIDERRSANIDKAIERINQLHFDGLAFLIAKKIQSNFGDGTFM
ncbi:MAG: hypothetical protein Q4F54_05885 [Coriobacteriia bacterium]|nr:hypothetical protein [Coriobacteriia bacterium]